MAQDPAFLNTSSSVEERRRSLAPEFLAIVKRERHERSNAEGIIVDLGTLSNGEHEELWEGKISLESRIRSGELSREQVEANFGYLPLCFVPVGIGKPIRCGDGSSIVDYNDANPHVYDRELGPQIFGGTFGETYAWRLDKGVDGQSGSFVDDLRLFSGLHSSRFAPGDHTDNHATEDNSGCGELTGQMRKNEMMTDEEYATVIRQQADTLAPLAGLQLFGSAAFEPLRASAAALLQRPEYYPQASKILKALVDLNSVAVAVLERPHNECSVTFNFVKDSTFHGDHYNAFSDKRIQNFNVDMWAIVEEFGAKAYSLVVDTVATAMNLTDGTLRAFARFPREQEAELTQQNAKILAALAAETAQA